MNVTEFLVNDVQIPLDAKDDAGRTALHLACQ